MNIESALDDYADVLAEIADELDARVRHDTAASLAYVTGASNYHAFESDPVPLPAYQVNPQGVSDRERGFDDFGA